MGIWPWCEAKRQVSQGVWKVQPKSQSVCIPWLQKNSRNSKTFNTQFLGFQQHTVCSSLPKLKIEDCWLGSFVEMDRWPLTLRTLARPFHCTFGDRSFWMCHVFPSCYKHIVQLPLFLAISKPSLSWSLVDWYPQFVLAKITVILVDTSGCLGYISCIRSFWTLPIQSRTMLI